MDPRKIIALLSAAAALGAGCVPLDVDLRDTRARQSPLNHVAPIASVRLAPRLLVLEATAKTPPTTTRYSIGPMLAAIFPGPETAPTSLDLVAAEFGKMAADNLVSKVQTTFTLEVLLQLPSGSSRIRVVGKGSTLYDYDNAAREAVDDAIAQLATQVRSAI